MTIAAPCLRLDRVSRHFGGLKAVDEVSLAIAPGARHAVIGPNGAGKTTLFNVISGELPATSGTISLSGTEITKLAPHQRAARGVSRTFQITRLFPDLTVMENLLLACTALDRRRFAWFRSLSSHHDLVDHATSLLDRFDLSSLAHTRARHLSYGDQRRLEVAISLAGRPRLLLLDEPMAGLSTPERVSMRRLLETLDPTIAVLLIEHDVEMAFAFADRVTVLHQGRVLTEGWRDEIGANKTVQDIYLGSVGRVLLSGPGEQ
ncbi:MAG TPA: ABC transporter ATP-binding protein [Vicinamibacterales bacterium]|nr:ABC transporter ATP-binding protein [Vicinamibacterales bacterium]